MSEDGKRVVSGSADNTLRVWNVDSGRELLTLSGHSDKVWACAISKDGKRAASGSDSTLKVWALDSGTCLGTVYGSGGFGCLAVRGTRLVAGDAAGNIWMLELSELPSI